MKGKNKKTFFNIFKYLVLLGYLGLIAVLVVFSLMPGKESAAVSNSIGDQIDEYISSKLPPSSVAVENVVLRSVTVNGKATPVSGDTITLFPGDTGSAVFAAMPDNVSNKSVIYSVSGDGLIVDGSGNFSAERVGSYEIKAASSENPDIFAVLKVRISEIKAEGITLDLPATMHMGQKVKPAVKLTPANTTDEAVLSVDGEAISLDENGFIAAVKLGNGTVTARVRSNPEIYAVTEVTVISSPDEATPPESVSIVYGGATEVFIGDKKDLLAKLLPEDSQLNQVTWKTSDSKIATVAINRTTGKAQVNFKKAGKVTVTVASDIYTDIKDSITFIVREKLSGSGYIKVQTDSPLFDLSGGNGNYTGSMPKDVYAKVVYGHSVSSDTAEITVESSDESVAYFYGNGIRACKEGTVIFTFTSTNGQVTVTSTLTLMVTASDGFVPVEEVIPDFSEITVDMNDEEFPKLSFKVSPENATYEEYSFSSSNSAVVAVDKYGKLTPKKAGSATITISVGYIGNYAEKVTAKVKVTVTSKKIDVEKVTINASGQISLFTGEEYTVRYYFTPSNATDKSVTVSSDSAAVSVNGSKIKAVYPGTAKITVTSKDNPSAFSELKVTVKDLIIKLDALTLSENELSLKVKETKKITVTFSPSSASFKGIIAESSDEDVASVAVGEDGKTLSVSALSGGRARITVMSDTYGDMAEYIDVTVSEILSEKISYKTSGMTKISAGKYSVEYNASAKITPVLDSAATVREVTFSSSDESVAYLAPDGVLVIRSAGITTLTLSSAFGAETVSTSIIVNVTPYSFKDTINGFYLKIRKLIGHFGAFLGLGAAAALVYFMFMPKGAKWKIVGLLLSVISGFVMAGLTEICQLPEFTSGRYCSFSDVLLDFNGYLSGAGGMYLLIAVICVVKFLVERNRKTRYAAAAEAPLPAAAVTEDEASAQENSLDADGANEGE